MPRSPHALTALACIIRASEESGSAALEQAIALAQASDALLHVTVIAPKASIPFSMVGSAFVSPLVTTLNTQMMTSGETLATLARQKAEAQGIKSDIRVVMNHVDIVAAEAMKQARACDLIVVDQPVAVLDTKGLVLEEALFRSGRPVLVATPKAPARRNMAKIMIAWDGSAHAARAVADALNAFPSIQQAEIVSVSGEKDISKALPGADLAHHLARKGIATTITDLSLGGKTVASVLDEHARKTGADLLVMGGFGHSRFREFLFGGVTVELTESASVPLLLAY